MAINVMSYVWKHSKCKGSDLLALLAIADWCNDDGDCYSGLDSLAKKTRVTVRGFQKIIERLEVQGELLVYTHMGKRTARGRTNAYRIPMAGVNENLPLTTLLAAELNMDVQPRQAKELERKPFPKPASDNDYVNTGSSSGDSDHMNTGSSTDMNTGSSTGVNISSSNTYIDTLKRNEGAPALSILPEMVAANEGLRIVTPSKEKPQTPANAKTPTPSAAQPPSPKETEPSLLSRPRDPMAENMRGYQIIETYIKAWPEDSQDRTIHHKSWFKKQAAEMASVKPPFTDEEITAATKHGISIKGAKFTFDDLGQALKELRMSRSKRNTSIYKPFEEPTRRRVTPEEFKAWQAKQAEQEAANE